MTTLYIYEDGDYRAASSEEVLAVAHALISRRLRVGTHILNSPARVHEALRIRYSTMSHEIFGALFLDSERRLIAVEELFRGTIDLVPVHVREVVKAAVLHGCSEIILFHNHPSASVEPSLADRGITQRLRSALALINVRVLDHLIVGDGCYSFQEHGLL
jgi:DNA repair protein RadC